ncbi:hypothetical protein DDZ13_00625 [Coraliomargarita sinensis]|uniref:DUF481 domain-containing protein n=1 Tax=Coraliomargarita sinensis TaxID=2174842 RepID=A0A317ZI56_9BACT|nr:DUF481 domain-containing protein [Coraliomargarita sinensis]PXA05404.1 hypothetical protein DDZ13_00625 [Coraliomargarita sinensis]
MSFLKSSHLLLALCVGVTVCSGSQTIVTMKSGECLIGEVMAKSNETTLVLDSALLGEIRLPKAGILKQESYVTDEAVQAEKSDSQTGQVVKKAGTDRELPLSEEEDAHLQEESLVDKMLNLQTPDSWNGNLRFGLDFSSGDSKWKQLYTRGSLVVDPKASRNYYRYTGSYTYRTTERNGETVKSTDRYDANFTYRRDVADSIFLQNSVGGRVDEIKGINHEVQELVGVGLRVKPVEKMEFIIGGGGGVEDYDPDFEDTRSGVNPVANVFQELTWRPFEKATLAQEFNYFINPDDDAQYNYVFSASFRYRLTDLLGFEISYDQNFDNDVGNGNVRDDSRWRNAIIVYF